VDDGRWERFCGRRARFGRNCAVIRTATVRVGGARVPAARALKQPDVRLASLADREGIDLDIDPRDSAIDLASVETEFKYEGYLRRQMASVERQRRQEGRAIPGDFAFAGVPGLTREVIERLSHVRPATLGQASRVPGVTPAAVAVIGAWLDRAKRQAGDDGFAMRP
jgi:tRNA uridine 5-carboxymethylaminomethyl modification enzyme